MCLPYYMLEVGHWKVKSEMLTWVRTVLVVLWTALATSSSATSVLSNFLSFVTELNMVVRTSSGCQEQSNLQYTLFIYVQVLKLGRLFSPYYNITGSTLFHGLCCVSSICSAGVCILSTVETSPALVNWFQLRSRWVSCFNSCRPSRLTIWLKLTSKNSRLG